MTPFRLHGPLLNPLSTLEAEWFPHGVIAVSERGRVLFAGDEESLPEHLLALRQDVTTDLILPGFIDAHVHLPQYDCRGKFGKTLLEWLNEFIYPEEARFADETVARDTARRFFHALVRAGTTTAMVFASVHKHATSIAFEEAEESGLRIIMGKVQMDRGVPETLCEDTEHSLHEAEELIQLWHRKTDRLWYAVTPRFAPACSMQLMSGCARLAVRYGTYIQTHINESMGEIERVRELFPDAESYTHLYHDAGLLGRHTMLAHNIHPSSDELKLCAETRVSVAHCPDSNLFLGSGRFPLESYEDTGIGIALGSDVGAGTSVSMLHVMRCMSYVQGRSLHPFIPLYHATLGGARALSLDDRVGNFTAGKQADFITLALEDHFCDGKPLEQLKALEAASVIVYRAQPTDVHHVWVGGEQLL